MNAYLLSIDSLTQTFSVIESGREIRFHYREKGHDAIFAAMQEGAFVFGYFTEPIGQIRCLFSVRQVVSEEEIVLIKLWESAEGIRPDRATLHALAQKPLCEISAEEYARILKQWIGSMQTLVPSNQEPPAPSLTDPKRPVFDYQSTAGMGENRLFYGIPGCGKSYHIEYHILGKDETTKKYRGAYQEGQVIRTTFYPDYSQTDFVGQLLPHVTRESVSGQQNVEYSFTPGPFTMALCRAFEHPEKKTALVIEEINRGNASAIFGELFQLLDRDRDGISEYSVVHVGMLDYLSSHPFWQNGEKIFYDFREIRLPGNLDLFATMNTSDQNVYTLDTAFVRRWERERIPNDFSRCRFASLPVPGMPNYTWEEFATRINRWIAAHLEDWQIHEDKQIGAFFVKESLLLQDAGKFAEKVLDYLWNDVSKFDHELLFRPYPTLADLICAYQKHGKQVFRPEIFGEKESVAFLGDEPDD